MMLLRTRRKLLPFAERAMPDLEHTRSEIERMRIQVGRQRKEILCARPALGHLRKIKGLGFRLTLRIT
jgi:hypothetical protein